MQFGTTTLATRWPEREPWQARVLRAAFWFVPRANPDNERLFKMVGRWAVEIAEDGKVAREIGIDRDGKPLFRAPDPRNFGFWRHSGTTFNYADLEPLSEEQFEELWGRSGASAV